MFLPANTGSVSVGVTSIYISLFLLVCLPQVALVATSMATMATEEITATLVVWIGGATSRHRSRLPCQPNPMETTC